MARAGSGRPTSQVHGLAEDRLLCPISFPKRDSSISCVTVAPLQTRGSRCNGGGGYSGPRELAMGSAAGGLEVRMGSVRLSAFVVLAGQARGASSWRPSNAPRQRSTAAGTSSFGYEDVVATPEESLRAIAEFLELKWSPRLSEMLSGRIRMDSSRTRAFERDLNASQMAELEHSIGALLRRYGYR